MSKIDPNAKGGLSRWLKNFLLDVIFQEDKMVWKSVTEKNSYRLVVAGIFGVLAFAAPPWSFLLGLVSVRKVWLVIESASRK